MYILHSLYIVEKKYTLIVKIRINYPLSVMSEYTVEIYKDM